MDYISFHLNHDIGDWVYWFDPENDSIRRGYVTDINLRKTDNTNKFIPIYTIEFIDGTMTLEQSNISTEYKYLFPEISNEPLQKRPWELDSGNEASAIE